MARNQPPYGLTRHEKLVLRRSEAPTLTITSDPYNSIAVVGTRGPDWAISFCAHGEGDNEVEAQERLRRISMVATGSILALTGPGLHEGYPSRGDLIVEGPMDAGVVIHASNASVKVRDIAGPVRIAATHARASVLDTTGQLDVTAGVVDFAGSSGRVMLSAESEINLKIAGERFEGTLSAWAQRSVRLLAPTGFTTPVTAVVGRRSDFVCRTEFASKVKHKRQGELHIFTYGMETGGPPVLHLRSDGAAVVIDSVRRNHQRT